MPRTVTLLLLLAACASQPATPAAVAPRRVLFVGNSLTSQHGLPALVAALAARTGDTLEVASVTADGASLDDHLASGRAERAIAAGPWDVVAFQQGPTSTEEGGTQLEAAMRRFAPMVRAAGGTPAMYMVWPTPDRRPWWDVSAANYVRAAQAVDGLVLPAGDAVRRALLADAALPLFEPDGFHPSAEGAYLAALTIAAALTRRDPATFPAAVTWEGGRLAIPAARHALLVAAAREALER